MFTWDDPLQYSLGAWRIASSNHTWTLQIASPGRFAAASSGLTWAPVGCPPDSEFFRCEIMSHSPLKTLGHPSQGHLQNPVKA